MNYHRWQPRVLAIVISLIVAVISNVARIFLIVGITQWTNRRIDISADHLLYGWIFFGIIMFIVMWIGMRYADPPATEAVATDIAVRPTGTAMMAVGVVMAALVLMAFPAIAEVTGRPTTPGVVIINLPATVGATVGEWVADDSAPSAWRPKLARNDAKTQGGYMRDGHHIDVAIGYCAAQRSGGCEAAAAENQPADSNSRSSSQPYPLTTQGQPARVLATDLLDNGGRVILSWYESAGCVTASRLQAKVCAARQRLTGQSAPGAFVALSIAAGDDRAAALATLSDFAAQWPMSDTFVRSVAK